MIQTVKVDGRGTKMKKKYVKILTIKFQSAFTVDGKHDNTLFC